LADGTTSRGDRERIRLGSAAMEPVLGGRDDLDGVPRLGTAASTAAMEPVLGGRDDASRTRVLRAINACRNGARPWRTGRRPGILEYYPTAGAGPQWSPSLADGTTVRGTIIPYCNHPAAMEPVLGGRDDPPVKRACPEMVAAAMEPVLGGRDDLPGRESRSCTYAAAMEPVLGGRDDGLTWHSTWWKSWSLRRNGARPWRTGRRGYLIGGDVQALGPQWSPSLADGTTAIVSGIPGVQN